MDSNWRPKPGDRIFRPRRIRRFHLRRVLGVPAVFSAGYGNVGSSIYYALGIVALVAMGATPIAWARPQPRTCRENQTLTKGEELSKIERPKCGTQS